MSRGFRGAACAAFVVLLSFAPAASAERYVALGDSYSSGTGTRTYFDSGCQKSVYAYPYLLSQQRAEHAAGVRRPARARRPATCSPTRSQSLTTDTGIVTITIGGNDAGFSSVITECAKPEWASVCDTRVNDGAELHPQHAARPAEQRLRADQEPLAQREGRRARLPAAVHGRRLQRRHLVRRRRHADAQRDGRPAARRHRAAARAAYGFTFKDAIPPFTGHAVCSSTEWLNGLCNPVGESYHPNRPATAPATCRWSGRSSARAVGRGRLREMCGARSRRARACRRGADTLPAGG